MDEVKNEVQPKEVTSTPPVNEKKENVELSASSAGARQVDKTFSELQAIQSTVKKFKPGDMVVPLLSIFTLALLTAFVYIPMITSGIKYRSQTKETQDKINQLVKAGKDLDGIDVTTLQTDLANARAVIPFSLQVSDFLSYIDDAAKAKGLTFKDITAGDITVRANDESRGIDPVMRGVSGPVKYTGNLSQVSAFLNEIQSASPFIISADQIKLKKQQDTKWDLSLTITGYYLNQASIPAVNLYNSFSSYNQFSDVTAKFAEKAVLLQK